MTNLTGVIRKLRKEKRRVHGEMERLNAALAALGSLGDPEGKSKRSRMPKARRPMSAAARKKIVAAQRALCANGRKTSEPSDWKERARRILQDCTNPPGKGGFVQQTVAHNDLNYRSDERRHEILSLTNRSIRDRLTRHDR